MTSRFNSRSKAFAGKQVNLARSLSGNGRLSGLLDTSQYRAPSGQAIIDDLSWGEVKPSYRLDIKKMKLRWGGQWLTYRPQILSALQYGPPIYEFDGISNSADLSSDEKAELIRFLLTLKLWETTPGEKIITPEQVWYLSLTKGPAAAEELDDLFSLSWREREIKSYNFCFPARFLPRFKEETDDINYSLVEARAAYEELVSFENTLRKILEEISDYKDLIHLADDRSIIEDRTTTTSYIASRDETMPHWQASFITSDFALGKLQAKRCVVNVYPGGTRDTIIADKAANNSIRWLDRSIINILSYIPESALTVFPSVFEKRKREVVYQKGWHSLRDIKKCGLTYNVRELFPIVEKCLNEFIPDERWRRFTIFEQIIVKDGDTYLYPKRGYGLGMANAAVTLCNIVVHRMALDRMIASPGIPKFHCKAIFGNDDADVVFFKNKDSVLQKIAGEYLEYESEIHAMLGNVTNPKKSVIKPYGLFYEEYDKPGWRRKESLVCNALACAYLAPDIRVAKHYIFSQSSRFQSRWAQEQLAALAHWWGPEFFSYVETELDVHYEVGGWLDLRSKGLKTSLLDLDRLLKRGYDTRYLSWICHYSRKFLEAPKPKFKTRGYVDNQFYSGEAVHSDPRIQLYTLTVEDVVDYYKRLTTFQRNYGKRLETFLSKKKAFVIDNEYLSLVKYILGETPWHAIPNSLGDYYPSDGRYWASVEVVSEICSTDREQMSGENLLRYLEFPDEIPKEILGVFLNSSIQMPDEAYDATVFCDPGILYSCSQFSNSGALPIFEYHFRNQKNPNPPLGIGQPKLVQYDPPKERIIFASSLRKKTKLAEKTAPIVPEIHEEDAWDDGNQGRAPEPESDLDIFSAIHLYKEENMTEDEEEEDLFPFDLSSEEEDKGPPVNRTIAATQTREEQNATIDSLLDAMNQDSHVNFSVFNRLAMNLRADAAEWEASKEESDEEDYDFSSLW